MTANFIFHKNYWPTIWPLQSRFLQNVCGVRSKTRMTGMLLGDLCITTCGQTVRQTPGVGGGRGLTFRPLGL